MAIIKCQECGKDVSDKAISCPHCGYILQEQIIRRTNLNALIGFILSLISLILNFWGIMGILATIFSFVGFYQIKDTQEKGKGFAILGIIIGIFSILYATIILINL